MKSLDEIALSYRTDKASKYHNYTPVYEEYFKNLRDKPILLLELGVGDINSMNREGESILMWREYFHKGQCYALDNDANKVARNTKCFWCDQTDKKELEYIISSIGHPDIIIDDASHIQSNTIESFENLFPLLQSGGIYCIEDCVTAFWDDWGGNSLLTYDDGHEIFLDNTHETIFTYMFTMCYYLNLKNQKHFNPPQNIDIPQWIKEIDSIHFHHSQIIIKKK